MFTFAEAQAYVYQAQVFGIRPGLERIKALLQRLGNPERQYPVVHIAGTNGKGSVSSFLAAIAASADKRCGWYTSPYLENYTERFRLIEGRRGLEQLCVAYRSPEISPDTYAALVSELLPAVEAMLQAGLDHPTVFELETAVALLWFARSNCDLVVLEVGLGGRLDSTNVIDQPLVSLITALSYDHMDRLGSDLADIAAEKAGIIKAGCPVILYNPAEAVEDATAAAAALQCVKTKCRELNAPLTVVSAAEIATWSLTDQGQSFTLHNSATNWEIALAGQHQQMNALMAIKAASYFASPAEIKVGLSLARWPGRLELMRTEPPLLMDGAHNQQGCAMLRFECEQRFKGQELIILCAMLKDKAYPQMLAELLGESSYKIRRLYLSSPREGRALPAAELAAVAEEILAEQLGTAEARSVILYDDEAAVCLAAALAESEASHTPLLVCGSLYLIGELRPLINAHLAKIKA